MAPTAEHGAQGGHMHDAATAGIETAYLDVAERWSAAAEQVEGAAPGHSARVAAYAHALAERAGVPAADLIWYRIGGLLHDIGKCVIPAAVLNKPGALSAAERSVVERHSEIGAEMVSAVCWPFDIGSLVLHHHERWDGGGYPHGLAREEIPFSARVMAIADVFDALTSERPYRPAYTPRQSLAIMLADSGGAFDPQLFELFRMMMMPRIAAQGQGQGQRRAKAARASVRQARRASA